MSTVLILGAGSDIARAIAEALAARGDGLILAGRRQAELARDAAALASRHQVPARAVAFDALDTHSHAAFWQSLQPAPDGVVCAVGLLDEQAAAEQDFARARAMLETNFTGCVSILDQAARHFAVANSGFIVGISSVAGDRGRASNYYYGAAKAGLTAYLSGLRNRFAGQGQAVRVITVKPGFVATRMTAGMNLPRALTASPEQVARAVLRALKGRRDVIYVRWFWRWIMALITHLPEAVFKRTRL